MVDKQVSEASAPRYGSASLVESIHAHNASAALVELYGRALEGYERNAAQSFRQIHALGTELEHRRDVEQKLRAELKLEVDKVAVLTAKLEDATRRLGIEQDAKVPGKSSREAKTNTPDNF